jgi:hypothetical protein
MNAGAINDRPNLLALRLLRRAIIDRSYEKHQSFPLINVSRETLKYRQPSRFYEMFHVKHFNQRVSFPRRRETTYPGAQPMDSRLRGKDSIRNSYKIPPDMAHIGAVPFSGDGIILHL